MVCLHDLPESYIAVKIQMTKNVCDGFYFSAVFLNNKHVPNGNKYLHFEKFCLLYCDTRS